MWKRILLAALFLVLVTGSVAGVYALAMSREGLPTRGEFECGTYDVRDVEVSAVVTVDASERESVRVTSRIELVFPGNHLLLWPLLEQKDDSDFRGMLRCLLGYNNDDLRPKDPEVTLAAGKLRVVDEVYRTVSSPPNRKVGIVKVEDSAELQAWRMKLEKPEALKQAKWTRFAVVAPPGWLGTPDPRPPASQSGTEIVWTDSTTPISWLVVPDTETVIALASSFGFSIARTALYWAAWVAAAIALLLCLRRVPFGGPDVLAARAEALRLAVPVLALAGFAVINDVGYILMAEVSEPRWDLVAVAEASLASCLVVFCAVWWRASHGVSVALGSIALWLVGMLVVAKFRDWSWLVVDGPLRATSKAAIAVLIATVLCTGIVQAVRSAFRLDGTRWAGVVPWIIGAAAGIVLMYNRLLSDAPVIARRMYLSPYPLDSRTVCCSHEWFSSELMSDVSRPAVNLLMVALCVVLVRYVSQAGNLDRRWIGLAAAVLFFVGPMYLDVELLSWRVPVWIVYGVVLVVLFARLRSPLDRPVGTSTVRNVVSALGRTKLRQQAMDWPGVLHRARTAEDAVSNGTGKRRPARMRERSSLFARLKTLARRDRAPAPGVTFPIAGLSPVDVLLCLGPGASIRDNVRTAVRCVLWTGLLIEGVLEIWQWAESQSLTQTLVWHLVTLATALIDVAAKWFATGVVVGVMWRWLPGRRGPMKVLPLVAVFALGPAVSALLRAATGHPLQATHWRDPAIFFGVLTVVGLVMDIVVLRELRTPWSRPWQAFRHAYGMRNLGGQLTFLLAQIAAALAIVAFLVGSPEPPAYPSVDPFQFTRPSGGN